MDLNPILGIFDKYGWPGLICAVLVFVLVLLFKNFSKTNEKTMNNGFEKLSTSLTNTISEQNKTLVEGLQEQNMQLVKHLLKDRDDNIKDTHMNSINQRKYIDNEINDKLKNLFYLSRASRVGVLEFHNSKENLSGLSFLWYDMHYERQAKELSAVSDKIKDKQASALFPIVEDIASLAKHTKVYFKKDIDNLYERSSVLYDDLVNKMDIHTVIYSGIYNSDTNEIMGLLVLEYLNEPEPIFINEILDEVASHAFALGTALTYHHKIKDDI